MHGGGGEAPFLVVWKYLESWPPPLPPPRWGSLVAILSTLRRGASKHTSQQRRGDAWKGGGRAAREV